MSLTTIRAALETRLNGLSGALPTAWENLPYSPTVGTAWQRVRLLLNDPVDRALTNDVIEHRGFLEVTLFYPQNAGSSAAATKAQAVADRFAPVQTLTSSTTSVLIAQTARIGSAIALDDWFVVPVSIPWQSFTG